MLTQAQINALISGAGGSGTDEREMSVRTAPKAVKTYDFRRPDKFSKDQLRTLGQIHEAIGRVAGNKLTSRLRTSVTVSLVDTAQMVFEEYLSGLTLPSYLIPLHANEFDDSQLLLMDLDLPLVLGWVDRLLGGAGRIPTVRKETTIIEQGLALKMVDEITDAMSEGWAQAVPMTFFAGKPEERYPANLRITAPTDVVAVLTYEVRYSVDESGDGSRREAQAAPLTICMPHTFLEPLLPRLSPTAWVAHVDKSPDRFRRDQIETTLQGVEVPLTAILGGVELSVDELAGLKAGDVIRFGERADQPVRLSVMDQAVAWALPGRVGDRVALRLLTPLQHLQEA